MSRKTATEKTIYAAVLSSFIVFLLLPLVISATAVTSYTSAALTESVLRRHEAIASSLAREVALFLDEQSRKLLLICRTLDGGVFADEDAVQRYADIVVDTMPAVGRIEVADREGVVRYTSPNDHDALLTNISRLGIVAEAVRTGTVVWSDIFISFRSGEPTIDGAAVGDEHIVLASVTLSSLQEIAGRIRFGETGYAFIGDDAGRAVAHPEGERITRRSLLEEVRLTREAFESGRRSTEVDGLFVAVDRIEATGWWVGVAQSSAEVGKTLRTTRTVLLLVLVTSAAAVVTMTLLSIRRVFASIEALARSAEGMAAGDYAVDVPKSSFREIVTLSTAMREMADAVRRRESDLQGAVVEREVMLQEIHHRVKNNLAVLVSLLSLQSDSVSSPEARAALVNAKDRIYSMAAVHELMYSSESYAGIEFGRFARMVLASIGRTYAPGRESDGCTAAVGWRLQAEELKLPMEQAVPLALILNELVSNAYKHAFCDDGSGSIVISLRQDRQRWVLTVADDGRGLPPGFDPDGETGLGYRLVTGLAAQINGSLRIAANTPSGTRIELSFEPA